MDYLIDVQSVSYSYTPHAAVLQDLTLPIRKNDLIIVKGESGAGKSTFLKLFNRFCEISDGRILFHDRELLTYKIHTLRSSIIYLPQLPYTVEGTVRDNLSFPFHFHSHTEMKFDPEKASEWLDYFQLNFHLNHEALKLSIGQRQRIALIRSLLLEPEVLLLDEPGSALDVKNRKLIEQKIESLIASKKITVLMATHGDISFSKDICRVFRLDGGRLINEQ